ncbi:hypothetical protein Hanom_Chr02g00112371 [Helianthus anomalus]
MVLIRMWLRASIVSISSNANQVNNERSIVAVNNPGNSNQSGPSNSNKALVVHADEGCDWLVQLGNQANEGNGEIAWYAKIIKYIKHVHSEEFSEDDESSGYRGSSDKESSNLGGYGSDSYVKENLDA